MERFVVMFDSINLQIGGIAEDVGQTPMDWNVNIFNMIRNLGGAIGIAALQTYMTWREQYHSEILTSQVALTGEASRARLAQLTDYFLHRVTADPALANHEAAVAVGHVLTRQATIMGVSDAIILQSILLGIALLAVCCFKKVSAGDSTGEAH